MVAAQPLFSDAWYRVSSLKPRLAQQLKIVRQPVRDQVWQVLIEAESGRQVRLNPVAWEFGGRCDGTHTVSELWELLLERLGEDAPTQDDILRMLAQLYRHGMVQFDAAPHLSMLFAQRDRESKKTGSRWINPMFLRMRLFDPTRLLDRIEPRLRPLFSRAGLFVWATFVLLGILACLVNFPQLRSEALARATSPQMLWLAWLSFPVIKAIHELSHALAVRRFGGEVHEVGLSLMFLTPAPYVDASAANFFVRRSHRVVVSAAGIMTELLLAAFAVGVWLAVQPGVVRDAALATLLICSVSTLLFNGNPLLRMDGYYVLSDALDLPNLAARSNAWWTAWAYRLGRGEQSVQPATLAAGELKWLVMYSPASWLFRLGILFALVTWLGGKSWLLGWVMALGLLGWMVLRGSSFFLKLSDGFSRLRATVLAWGALAAFSLALTLFVLPVPSIVVARGVVWPPEGAQVRAEMAGIVTQTPAVNGTVVQAGDLLLTLSDPALSAERDKRVSQLAGLQAQQYLALMKDPVKAADIAEDIARSEAEIARAEEQLALLMVRSRSSGRLVLSSLDDLPGSHAARGAMLGYIVGDDAANVRVVLDEQDILLVRNRIRTVEVRLADVPTQPMAGKVGNEVPAATRKLPSSALGERHGGNVLVDPGDKEGLRTLAPVFLLDVNIPGYVPVRIGGRAWVRFDLGYEPAGKQLLRRARQVLLHDFSPLGQS